MKYTFFIILLIFSYPATGQFHISGKISDAKTGEPLAFANIVYDARNFKGVRSDIDGNFSISSQEKVVSLTCSFMGYEKQTFMYEDLPEEGNMMIIKLRPLTNELTEVLVRPGESPADRIIRKVILNKRINDPENIPGYTYRSYNKIVYDFLFSDSSLMDSLKLIKRLEGGHLLITESVTEGKYLKPGLSNETVTGMRFSGFKNQTIPVLSTSIQPFSFYGDIIKLLDISYLNPVSRGSVNSYRFSIEDTLFQEKDTVYIISFVPRKNRNFDGLTGLMYINSNRYAIQNVIATPFEKATIDLKIQQQYSFVDEAYWFPEQLNYVLTMKEYPSKKIGITANGKSYISGVSFDSLLSRNDFPAEAVSIDEKALLRDSLFWKNARRELLDSRELTTYRVIDSIGERVKFDRLLRGVEKLTRNRFPVKMIDIDISKSLAYNKYEGMRPGLALYTNESLSERITFGGFAGYGIRRKQLLYGGEVSGVISEKRKFSIGLRYQHNLVEAGNHGLSAVSRSIFRSRHASRMELIEQKSGNISFSPFRYAMFGLSVNNTSSIPQYSEEPEVSIVNTSAKYSFTDITASFRFAFREKVINTAYNEIRAGSQYPVLNLLWCRGIPDLFAGKLEFNRIEGRLDHSVFIRKLGNTRYRLESGFLDSPLPYAMMFTGKGSFDEYSLINIPFTFQVMRPYEFLSDRYLNVFFIHNFGSLLFKEGKFAPAISISGSAAWGNLQKDTPEYFTDYMSAEKGYFETGLQIDNLLKINYLNIAYAGFGAAAYYRMGNYSLPRASDNLSLRITFNYTIR